MGPASIFTLILFVSLCGFVGLRLVLISRTGHRLPALSIGLTFLLSGCIGFPLLSIANVFSEQLGPMLGPTQVAGFAAINLGSIALWTFTWRTFRPASRIAAAGVSVAFVLLLGVFLDKAMSTSATSVLEFDAAFWIGFAVRALSPLWAAIESLRYFALMRRRERVGLADPVVANRFLLWGIASLGTASMSASTAVALLVGSSMSMEAVSVVRILGMMIGLVSGVSMWLAFFPPTFYRRRFESTDVGRMAS